MRASFVEMAAQLLERDEREAVLGDLTEAGEGAWQGLCSVLGLAVRREVDVWKDWRSWLAAFGVALPGSLLLMGFSLAVSWRFQRFLVLKLQPGPWSLIASVLLLTGWAWTGGFVVGSLSRRTLWVSLAACCSPCIFCLLRFHEASISRLCLFLFLVPAVSGLRQGLQASRLKLGPAIFMALSLTILMAGSGEWLVNWVLLWPAWYLVAVAQKSASTLEESAT